MGVDSRVMDLINKAEKILDAASNLPADDKRVTPQALVADGYIRLAELYKSL